MCHAHLNSDVGRGFGGDVPQDVQGLVEVSPLNGQLAVGDHYLDLVGSALAWSTPHELDGGGRCFPEG